MASWEKIKFFYETMLGAPGSTLGAGSTLTGTDVANIYNMLEVNRWEAADAADPQYITWSADVLQNSGFEAWTAGLPDYWTLTGQGAAVAPDTATVKGGATSAMVTRSGADCTLGQAVTPYGDYLGQAFSLGVWVLASSPSQARVSITDGLRTAYSAWHSGSGGWEYLEAELVPSEVASTLSVGLEVAGTDGAVYFDSASAGVRRSADYLAVMGHEFHSSGGCLVLQASDDGFVSETRGLLSVRPASDRALVAEARLLMDPGFEVWDSGPSAAPAGWVLGGGPSASVAREGLTVRGGAYSARLASGANEQAYLEADHIANPLDLAYLSGKTVTFGCHVLTADAGRLTLRVYDDDGTGAQFTESPSHTGGSSWQFLQVTRTLRAGLVYLGLRCQISAGAASTAYLDSAVLRLSATVQPCEATDYVNAGALSRRHWRLKMAGHTAPPRMGICIWGDKTVLDYASTSFDPHGEAVQASVNVSNAGYVLGVHERYRERRISLSFRGADQALYEKVRSWWEVSGLKNFFMGWERANNPDEVFLVYPEKTFNNPLRDGGLYRDINIRLKGRKE